MKLVIENISKNFDKKEVIKNLDFTFDSNKIYGLLGVNGSGKTTFFNLISKEEKLTSGKIYLEKENIIYTLNKTQIGYVKSIPMLPDFLTAKEFVEFYLEINQHKIDNIKSADEYLDDFFIDEQDKDKLLKDFSHGMKNKILMLINFINNPDIILLDEPMTSFDPLITDKMNKKLKEIKKDKVVIISTHIMHLAIDMCDEIIILKDGKFESIDNVKLGKVKSEKLILKQLKDIKND